MHAFSILLTGLFLLSGSASAAEIFCTSGVSTDAAVIDLVTGQGTAIGSTGAQGAFGTAFDPNGKLYTVITGATQRLATVDPVTGAATPIGSAITGVGMLVALEIFHDGTLYAASQDGGFYRIDTTTAAVTVIALPGTVITDVTDLAFDGSGTLWATANNNLYTINPTTGTPTLHTAIAGITEGTVVGIMFAENNTLYATNSDQSSPVYYSKLFSLNPQTGQATFIAATGLDHVHGGDIHPGPCDPLSPPKSVITSPLNNWIVGGTSIAITGTAAQCAGLDISRVEVSTDGGLTWKTATGTAAWSYSWTLPTTDGTYVLESRATDRTGKTEIWAGDGVTVRVKNSAWTIEGVDDTTSGTVNSTTAIAVDSKNKPYISYMKSNLYYEPLKIASRATGSWVAQVLDDYDPGNCSTGDDSSIVIDAADKIHISHNLFCMFSPNWLRYTTNESGAWTTVSLQEGGHGGSFTSMALDSGQKLHIASWDSATYGIKYATTATGTWTYHAIETGLVNGGSMTLALDSRDMVHITYIDFKSDSVRYATNASGSWVVETVAAPVSQFGLTLAIDSRDVVHIFYQDKTTKLLKHASKETGSWVTDPFLAESGSFIKAKFDADDVLHMTFNGSASSLQYLTYAAGVVTYRTNIENQGVVSSFVFDGNGKVHMSYYRNSAYTLRYATTADILAPASAISGPQSGARLIGSRYPVTGVAGDGPLGSGIAAVEISADGGKTWQPAADTSGDGSWTSWKGELDLSTLPNGNCTILSRAHDKNGNVETPGKGVTVITQSLWRSTVMIGNGSDFTKTPSVALTLSAWSTNGVVTDMRFSNNGSDWSSWQAYAATADWTLADGDGKKTVFAQFQNALGEVSEGCNDTITLDTTLPQSAIVFPVPTNILTGATQTIRGTASDGTGVGVSLVKVSTDGGGTWVDAVDTSGNGSWASWRYIWTLPTVDGEHILLAQAFDRAGNAEVSGAGIAVSVYPCTDNDRDGFSARGGICGVVDCNDGNAAIKPGVVEVCDGVDNDCDGLIDEGLTHQYFRDQDGDGFGDPNAGTAACTAPAGFVADKTDCNDADPAIKPSAMENCLDGIDNNCNGRTDITDLACIGVACTDNMQCGAQGFCRITDGACGASGTCQPLPASCPQFVVPVCGCDDQTYSSACEAERQGVNVAAAGECAPAVYSYYFPSIKDNDAIGWENFLSVQAKEPVTMAVTIRVYDMFGVLKGTYIYSDTDPLAKGAAIAPNARVSQRPSWIAGSMAAPVAVEGSVIVETSVPAIASINCIANFYKGFSLYEAAKPRQVHNFPKAFDGPDNYQVYMLVQNIHAEAIEVTAQLFGKTSAEPGHGAIMTYTVPAYGTLKVRPSEVAPPDPVTGRAINFSGSVVISADLAVPAMCRYEAGQEALAIYESTVEQPALSFPVIKDGRFGGALDFQNFVSVVNPNTTTAATITMILYNLAGQEEGRLTNSKIAAGGKNTWRPSWIKGSLALPRDFAGSVVVQSDIPVVGQTNTIYPGNNQYGADGFDLFESAIPAPSLFFPKAYDNLLGSGTGATKLFDNFVYVQNPDGTPKTVTIELFNNNGTANGIRTVTIDANATHVFRPKDLVLDTTGTFRGSVRVTETSGLPITGGLKYEFHRTTSAASPVEAMTIYRSMGQ